MRVCGSAPHGAARRRRPLDGASCLACGQATCSHHSSKVGRLVGAPVLEHPFCHRLAGQVDPGRALFVPADGDQLGAAVELEPAADDAAVLGRGFGGVRSALPSTTALRTCLS